MVVLCNANVIIVYDKRRLGLSNAPLDMGYDNNKTEQWYSEHDLYSRIHVFTYPCPSSQTER